MADQLSPTNTVNSLIFGPRAVIQFGGNAFINVPTLLQVDGTPLIETITNNDISKTTRVSIFSSGGEALAEVLGTRLILTPAGEKAGVDVTFRSRLIICNLAANPLFEIRHVSAACLAVTAELYSPTGMLVKSNAFVPFATFGKDGRQIAAAAISKRTVRNSRLGFSVIDAGKTICLGDQ